LTLQQLKYVIEVARCRSISQAAQNLFISQPSLSNALKELEKEMGITIFSRTNKGIIITTEGSEFLGYARQVVEQAELLEIAIPIHNQSSSISLCLPSTMHLQ